MANQRMTQTQLVRSLAEGCEVNNKTARGFLDGLSSLAIAASSERSRRAI